MSALFPVSLAVCLSNLGEADAFAVGGELEECSL